MLSVKISQNSAITIPFIDREIVAKIYGEFQVNWKTARSWTTPTFSLITTCSGLELDQNSRRLVLRTSCRRRGKAVRCPARRGLASWGTESVSAISRLHPDTNIRQRMTKRSHDVLSIQKLAIVYSMLQINRSSKMCFTISNLRILVKIKIEFQNDLIKKDIW